MTEHDDHLRQALHAVHDLDSFFAFVDALDDDRLAARDIEWADIDEEDPNLPDEPDMRGQRGALGWRQVSLGEYLMAAALAAEAEPTLLPEHPTWQDFARFLHAGKTFALTPDEPKSGK